MSDLRLVSELDFNENFQIHAREIENWLNHYLGDKFLSRFPGRLRNALRYTALAPGKRLRPLLVVLSAESCGGRAAEAYSTACAVELIHAASLVHDDLPAMDDDAMRRNRPSLHESEDEALAIIAGVTLVATAFEIVSQFRGPELSRIVSSLSQAIGGNGMCGGQVLDLQGKSSIDPAPGDPDWLEDVFHRKTGSLMSAACCIGALVAGADDAKVETLAEFGQKLGVAFQISDDLRDRESDREIDRHNYAIAFGVDAARERVSKLRLQLGDLLRPLGDAAAPLRALAHSALSPFDVN
jgi:geranylgeranyl diphosphate synthase type II